MSKRKTEILYEKGTGAELFTSREAARFLDYHPVAFRHLVSKGKIPIHSRTGNYPLFLREELEKYQVTNKWAGKKAGLKGKPGAANPPSAKSGVLAIVTVNHNKKNAVVEQISDFKWADMPAICAKMAAKYGKIPFQITLELPNGASFTIVFRPSAK